jgi:hypothetical protein
MARITAIQPLLSMYSFEVTALRKLAGGTELKSVGFWSVSGNIITLHMLVIPMEDDTTNAFFRGRYSYSYLTAEVLGSTDDVIEIITGTTGNTNRMILAKCT